MTGSQWIDARGATLEGLLEHGMLWVVEKLPPSTGNLISQWKATVTKRRINMIDLFRQWASSGGIGELPRTHQAIQHRFLEALRNSGTVALILNDAHIAHPSTLAKMRLLAEQGALVVLVGDVAVIRANTDQFSEFSQRASYVVAVDRLFNEKTA